MLDPNSVYKKKKVKQFSIISSPKLKNTFFVYLYLKKKKSLSSAFVTELLKTTPLFWENATFG